MKEDGVTHIRRIYREDNKLANFLTNMMFNFIGTMNFHHFQELPTEAKKILNLDKQEIPQLRIRPQDQRESD